MVGGADDAGVDALVPVLVVQVTELPEEEEERAPDWQTDLSVWCSWVTWYWVVVSRDRSSVLSNSLTGESAFLRPGMLDTVVGGP